MLRYVPGGFYNVQLSSASQSGRRDQPTDHIRPDASCVEHQCGQGQCAAEPESEYRHAEGDGGKVTPNVFLQHGGIDARV